MYKYFNQLKADNEHSNRFVKKKYLNGSSSNLLIRTGKNTKNDMEANASEPFIAYLDIVTYKEQYNITIYMQLDNDKIIKYVLCKFVNDDLIFCIKDQISQIKDRKTNIELTVNMNEERGMCSPFLQNQVAPKKAIRILQVRRQASTDGERKIPMPSMATPAEVFFMERMGERIRYVREHLLRYTQDWVAEQLGIDQPTYCKMENGVKRFPPDKLAKLGEVLNWPRRISRAAPPSWSMWTMAMA